MAKNCWPGKYLGWTKENCHSVGQILATHYSSLLLLHTGFGIGYFLIQSRTIFKRPVGTETHMTHANRDLEAFLSYHTSQMLPAIPTLIGETHLLPRTAVHSIGFTRDPSLRGGRRLITNLAPHGATLSIWRSLLLLIGLPDKCAIFLILTKAPNKLLQIISKFYESLKNWSLRWTEYGRGMVS